jgi:hypothetical protein
VAGRVPLALHRLVHGHGGTQLLRAVGETAVGPFCARTILPRNTELCLLEIRCVLDVLGVVVVEALGADCAATSYVILSEFSLAKLLTNVNY